MKWLAAMLMIVNVAVYLWASGRQFDQELQTQAVLPDVNREGMLLLSEVEPPALPRELVPASESDAGSAETSSTVVQEDGSVTTGLEDAGIIEAEDIVTNEGGIASGSVATESYTNVLMCYRVGPFKGEVSWDGAIAWVNDNNIEFRHVTSHSRELRAVRVFLGPFASPGETEPVVSLLKQKELDHFVYQVEDGSTRVSLGYFTQEELATKFMEYLATLDVTANSLPEYRQLGPFNWMEIPLDAVDGSTMSERSWQEEGVTVSRVAC